jgi:hypothetical protein
LRVGRNNLLTIVSLFEPWNLPFRGAALKKLGVVLIGSVWLCGCGIVGKLDAISNLEASSASYKACLAEHRRDATSCEVQRASYQADLSEAQRTRGMLTNWSRL